MSIPKLNAIGLARRELTTQTLTSSPAGNAPYAITSTFDLVAESTQTAVASTSPIGGGMSGQGSGSGSSASGNTGSASDVSSASSRGLSAGEVAGIGIGCALAGALLATAVLMCFRRRSSSRPTREKATSNINPDRYTHKDGTAVDVKESSSNNSNLDNILPQPLADDEVGNQVNGLFTMIEGHVYNYYHEEPMSGPIVVSKDSMPIAILEQKQADIEGLLAEPRTRSSAISAIVCGKLLESISVTGLTELSLLPPVVTGFLLSVLPPEEESHAYQLSLSRWRVSTMYLRGSKASQNEWEHRQQATQAIIGDLDHLLGLYVNHEEASRRLKDLELLCERTAKVGMMLISQPARWGFSWKPSSKARPRKDRSQGKKPRLVLFPGLFRVTDNGARDVPKPRSFLEAKVLQ